MSNPTIDWKSFRAINITSIASKLAVIAYDTTNDILAFSFQKDPGMAYTYRDFTLADIDKFINLAISLKSWGAAHNQFIKGGLYAGTPITDWVAPAYLTCLMDTRAMQFNPNIKPNISLLEWFCMPPGVPGIPGIPDASMDHKFMALASIPIEQYSF